MSLCLLSDCQLSSFRFSREPLDATTRLVRTPTPFVGAVKSNGLRSSRVGVDSVIIARFHDGKSPVRSPFRVKVRSSLHDDGHNVIRSTSSRNIIIRSIDSPPPPPVHAFRLYTPTRRRATRVPCRRYNEAYIIRDFRTIKSSTAQNGFSFLFFAAELFSPSISLIGFRRVIDSTFYSILFI